MEQVVEGQGVDPRTPCENSVMQQADDDPNVQYADELVEIVEQRWSSQSVRVWEGERESFSVGMSGRLGNVCLSEGVTEAQQ